MKTVLIIGVGTLGQHLAVRMQELGNEVMIVDKNEKLIQKLSTQFKDCFVADCTDEGVLRSLGVTNFDYCFVAIREESYDTMEITSMLKELGAKCVVVCAHRERQAEFLKKIGADEVFFPEKEIAEKLAVRYNSTNIFDYAELTSTYSIFEIAILSEWIGKNMIELNIRTRYHINIIAVKKGGNLNAFLGGQYVFEEGDHVVVIGEPKVVFKLAARNEVD